MILSLLRKRRSIRQFQRQRVEPEKVEKLMEALLRSPSSRGRNPWDFILVDDPDLLHKLAHAKAHGSTFVGGAPLAVVLTGDPVQSDVWIEDCAIASIILQLTAESLGLASCWAQIRLRLHRDGRTSDDYLKPLLNLPDGHRVLSIVGVGYPAEEKTGHPRETLLWTKIHWNTFGNRKPASTKETGAN
jgi:nitroreductase